MLATERASSEIDLKRVWQSAQPSRCATSSRRLSGSSTIRRSVPSVRCATGDLLTQSVFRAPQHCSDLSDTYAECPGDLGVAEPARAQDQHRGRSGRQPGESFANPAPILIDLDLLLRVQRPVAFLGRLRDLTPVPASGASQLFLRGGGGGPAPARL